MRALALLPLLAGLALVAAPARPKAHPAAKSAAGRQMTPWAPPVIPHPLERGTACMDCHGVPDSGAPALPHRMIANCQACHIQQADAKPYRTNAFRFAAERPGPNRAGFAGAPPAIPHHTLMREVCVACHGKEPRHGARNPHPDRPNCVQCHLPSGAGR